MKKITIILSGVLAFTLMSACCSSKNVVTTSMVTVEDDTDDAAAEAAAREARCNARRMNNPDLKQAFADIDADLVEAEQAAAASNDAQALSAVADAKAKVIDARNANKSGKYCKAYDLINEAYGFLAESYAANARYYAAKVDNELSRQAADDANLYADASHKDGLDCAMAACRNAKINSEIARDADLANRGVAYDDPKVASRMADDAIALAKRSASKGAMTDAKDASGKAYRGTLPESYAAAAKSFAASAQAAVAKKGKGGADAKAAAKEAQALADEAAIAARNGDVAAAYSAAVKAREAARLACGIQPDKQELTPATKEGKSGRKSAKAAAVETSTDRADLQKMLDKINATDYFDFAKAEPQLDSKSDLAIEALCKAMAADKAIKVLITGHTDNVGSAASNMACGKKRAEALKSLMVKRGAPAASISTTSRGDKEPAVENDSDEHRRQNRRAVITLR